MYIRCIVNEILMESEAVPWSACSLYSFASYILMAVVGKSMNELTKI